MYQTRHDFCEFVVIMTDKIRCVTSIIKQPSSHRPSFGNMSVTTLYPAGTAPIKAEFLLSTLDNLQPQVDDASAEEGTNHAAQKRRQEDDIKDDGTTKKPKLSGSERRRLAKEEKKAQRGSNKGRRWAKVRDEVDLCWKFAGSGKCDFGSECVSFVRVTLVDLYHSLPR